MLRETLNHLTKTQPGYVGFRNRGACPYCRPVTTDQIVLSRSWCALWGWVSRMYVVFRAVCFRAQKLLALAPNEPEDGGDQPSLPPPDAEQISPTAADAAAEEAPAWVPHGAGPATCACWVGPSGKIFATGHQSGQVVVWALPPEPKDAGALHSLSLDWHRPCIDRDRRDVNSRNQWCHMCGMSELSTVYVEVIL